MSYTIHFPETFLRLKPVLTGWRPIKTDLNKKTGFNERKRKEFSFLYGLICT